MAGMRGASTTSFEEFLEWREVQQEHLLDELVAAREECECGRMNEKDRQELIVRALTQYEVYYEEKSRAAHHDVFSMFSPPWCSSLECAFLWLSGFRPTALFRLVSSAVSDLSPDQLRRLDRLKAEIRMEERALCDEQAKIQESISSPDIMEAMKRVGLRAHGLGEAGREADTVMQALRAGMEALAGNADTLRTRTATKVVEILNSAQSIRFLVAATQLERNMRIKGRDRDAALASISPTLS
ncbi:hypothetical protein V2J09_018571 [Rumex salicifolius]